MSDTTMQGIELLHRFAENSRLESNVVSNHKKRTHLDEIVKELEGCIKTQEEHPNKEYNGLGEAVARCFILYEKSPDAYAKLVGGICGEDEEVFLDCFEGLWRMNLLRLGLADDHDYAFNQHCATIEIASTASASQALTPARFLQMMRGLNDDLDYSVESGKDISKSLKP